MDVNYRFWIAYVTSRRPGTVLDFGCGNALVVSELRRLGIDCYGVDVFYEGMEFDSAVLDDLLAQGIVRRYQCGEPLPFPAETFDLIISNMVLEHVRDLARTSGEFKRVLKPSGMMRHHFPSREVLREGHIGIPLAHRLPPGRLRATYTLLLRTIGFGEHRETPPREWTKRSLDWIDRYCFYLSYCEIEEAFAHFEIEAKEPDYCRFRATGRRLLPVLPSRFERLQTVLLRRLAFMALEMRPRPRL